jgi:hypothetical protein
LDTSPSGRSQRFVHRSHGILNANSMALRSAA